MLKQFYFALAVAGGVLAITTSIIAQNSSYAPKPLSTVGGPTGEALNQIYRSGVGQGYSGQSLNTLSLQYGRDRTPYAGQSTTRSGGFQSSTGFGQGAYSGDKPFSSFSPGPTTSPYLNLFREDFSGNSDLNYNTLVQPQLQQQQINQQVQRASIDQNRRIDNLAAKADFNAAGDKNDFPTGHPTARRYTGHYYQMPSGRTRKGR